MIQDKVVFILGAGASVPFGFPTGAELVRKILSVTKSDVPDRLQGLLCEEVCARMGFDRHLMKDLQLTLRHAQVGSIDEFLAQPSHKRFVELGRFLIAAHVLPMENPDRLYEVGEGVNRNWYQLLWDHLRTHGSIERLIEEARITFVTFNYDRSLEHYLFSVFRHHFESDSSKIEEFLRRSIFHVHGMLGAYRKTSGGASRRYSPKHDLEALRKAMEGINIIHEVEAFPNQSEITRRLEEADRVVFLGFQYHSENIRKLFRGVRRRSMRVIGSCYGMSDMECAAARSRIGQALQMDAKEVRVGGASALGCYDFLRQHFEFD
jgi:hypothetical protein